MTIDISVQSQVSDLLSPSKLGMWERCQAQYCFRYVEGLKVPPSAAMAKGRATDEMANSVYSEKMVSGVTATAADCAERWAARWDIVRQEVEKFDEETPAEILDKGVAVSRIWRDTVAVPVQPVVTQAHELAAYNNHGERVPLNSDGQQFVLQGYADLIATRGGGDKFLAELKTRGRKLGEDEMTRALQPPTYKLLFGTDRVEWHACVTTKVPQVQVELREITDQQTDGIITRYAIMQRQVRAALTSGDFLPNRSQMLCSRRFCGYWAHCEQRFGGHVVP